MPTRSARASGLLGLVVSAALSALPVAAQEPPAAGKAPVAEPAEVQPPTAIPLAQVLPRADLSLARLREVQAVATSSAAIQEIAAGIDAVRAEMIAQATDTRKSLETTRSLDALRALDADWRGRQAKLTEWSASVSRRAAELDTAYAEATEMRELWRVTERAARAESDTPPPLLARIDEVQSAIAKARNALAKERLAVLQLQEKLGHEMARSDEVLRDLSQARSGLERELLVRESPPLWTALGDAMEREPLGVSVVRALNAEIESFQAAWPPALPVWIVVALIGAASFGLALAFRDPAARLAEEDPSFETTARLFERPYAVAVLLAILGVRLAWRQMPALAEDLLRTVLLLPALRLLGQVVGPTARRPVLALAAFYVVGELRVLLEGTPHVERLVFAVEMVAACAMLLWILRPARLSDLPSGAGGLALVGRGLKAGLVLCALALLADLIGFARLGFVLGDGVIRSLVAAVFVYAIFRVADGIVAAARRTWPLSLLRAIRRRPFGSSHRTYTVLRAVAFASWVFFALEIFTVRDEAVAGTRAVLGARAELGELSVSLGDVLTFGLTVWIAMLVSRAIRFLLEEDVFPRMRLPRGVPNAISASLQYATVLIAFFLALAAAGIDLSRFAILAGAFGVGVGFGLQNVVNGFVSGLILLYERPVQIGDTVQVADVQGTIRRIGIRSSTVRTFDGAEVIVPNSSLIAERVTNWTLSDRLRRIEIDVGVEYGNDPERVLRLLTDVAKAQPSILAEPPPLALFNRFGTSSLDFQIRAWTENVDDASIVRSNLAVAIWAALDAAGIEMPYPTYDVRLQRSDT